MGVRRRGVAGVVVAVVVVLVLAAATVVAELVVRAQTRDRLTAVVVAGLDAPAATTRVEIPGLVLPQVLRGRLDEVGVTADEVTLDEGTFTDVVGRATGVTVRAPYTAATLTVTGVVPPATIHDLVAARGLDLDLTVRDERGLRASGTVLGIEWGVTLTPRVADGRLLVDVVAADLAGFEVAADVLPAAVRDALTGLEVPLDGLPEGLVLRSVRMVPGGVEASLDGTDVPLEAL